MGRESYNIISGMGMDKILRPGWYRYFLMIYLTLGIGLEQQCWSIQRGLAFGFCLMELGANWQSTRSESTHIISLFLLNNINLPSPKL